MQAFAVQAFAVQAFAVQAFVVQAFVVQAFVVQAFAHCCIATRYRASSDAELILSFVDCSIRALGHTI